jgi:amidase
MSMLPAPAASDPVRLTASEAAAAIATRRLTAEAYAEALLARVAAREGEIRAWASIDAERLRGAARRCDRESARGPLHGVPIGIKDVIDTVDFPTECNSAAYAGHRPAQDAECVRRLKRAGAIIMGKTVTTEFAYMRPGPTRNPHDPTRTPGGSSSGSGAAVADFMVPVALGTQTGGSNIRPAAFCGAFGYKPDWARFPVTGLKHLAPSLDTIGLITRSVEDAALVSGVLAGRGVTPVPARAEAPRLVVFVPNREQAEPASLALLERIAKRAGERGARVRALALHPEFLALNAAHRAIMAAETARAFRREWSQCRDLIGDVDLRNFIAHGLTVTPAQEASAESLRWRMASWLGDVLAPDETILSLSCAGEATPGLASTGHAAFNRIWTLLHSGCLHVPLSLGPAGMPLGLQLIHQAGDERVLFAAGKWLAELSDLR